MIRLIAMLAFYAVAFVPGWFAYQEIVLSYYSLLGLQAQYSFAQEMTLRGHILAGLVFLAIASAIAAVGDHVSETPEERKRRKQLQFEARTRELKEFVRLRPLRR